MATILDLEVAIRRYTFLLLDTSLLIDEFKRHVSVVGRIPRPQRATSLISVWEFVHLGDGRLIEAVERNERRAWMDRQEIQSVWSSKSSEHTFRNLLWHTSSPAGVADCLLAAESVNRKWPLVTRNVRHFQDVEGMVVIPY